MAWEINRPVPFQGTEEEAQANYETHNFHTFGEDTECMDCATRTYHKAAHYPCGADVPRTTLSVGENEQKVLV